MPEIEYKRRASDDLDTRISVLEQRLDMHLKECEASNKRIEKQLDGIVGVIDGVKDDMKNYLKSANEARDVLHSRITSLGSEFKTALIWGLFTLMLFMLGGFGTVMWSIIK